MRGRDRDRLFRVGFVRGENNSDLIWNEDRVREDHGKRTTRNDD